MNISTALLQEIIAFLTPLPCFQNENARTALLISSGLRDLLSDIENNVTPGIFVSLAVNHLDRYGEKDGEPALMLLLRGVQEKVGTDKQVILRQFEKRLQTEWLQDSRHNSIYQTSSVSSPSIEKPIKRESMPRNIAENQYDVFLSYNAEERNAVIQIARYLRDNTELRLWLDQWHAIPGISASDNLKQGLEASKTCAVFIGKAGEGRWQKSEIRKAIDQQKQKSMLRVIPVLLPDAPEELEISSFLLENTWVDFRGKSLNDDDALWRLECGIRGVVPGSGRPDPAKDSQVTNSKEHAGAPIFPGMSPDAYFKTLQAQSQPQLTLPQPQKTPKRQTRYGIMFFILAMTLVLSGWTLLQNYLYWEEKPTLTATPTQNAIATQPPALTVTPTPEPTPTIKSVTVLTVTPTKQSEPTPTPLSVASCWDNETPGATCKEETTGMEFVYVPGGEFWMGCGENEQGYVSNEKPRHKVTIKGFWMGKYEVTQAQWEAVTKDNPSIFKGANRPVELVSWNDTQTFLKNFRNRGDFGNLTPRLPSEAEWEYACRAGTDTAYSFENLAQLGEYAWYADNSGGETHPVGQKQPNDFGLYDMHGNVWEWVADTWHDNYNGAPNNGDIWGNLGD